MKKRGNRNYNLDGARAKPPVRIDGPRGGELGLFQFLKYNKATLTYAILVRHQFTNRITKLPTQAKRDKIK